DHLRFPLAEAGLAFLLEDVRDVDAAAGFDLVIAVDEAHAALIGEALADGGLARAHRPHDEDIAVRRQVTHLTSRSGAEYNEGGRGIAAAAGASRRRSGCLEAFLEDLRCHEDQELALAVVFQIVAEHRAD